MRRTANEIVAPAKARSPHESLKTCAFGPFVLDAQRLVLSADGIPLRLGPRVVGVLRALVERPGAVVTKAELLDAIWPGEDVGESSISQAIYLLRTEFRRRGCGDAIVTVPRRGYRFTAPLAPTAPPTPPIPAPGRRPPLRMRRPLAALALAAALLLVVFPGPGAVTGSVPHPPALTAHGAELYRLGRYHWNLRTAADFARAETLFAEVVRSDPRSPAGYVGLADTELMVADYECMRMPVREVYAHARAHIAQALALDANNAPAHASLAMLYFAADHNVRGSEREFQRALDLEPDYAVAHHWYGTTLMQRGLVGAGARQLREAIRLDPLSPATGAWLAEASYYQRHFADAIRYERLAIDLRPTEYNQLRQLGLAYEMSGNVAAAIQTFERLARIARTQQSVRKDVNTPALLAEAYARAGRWPDARARLREAMRQSPRDEDTAFALLAAGERARGLRILAAVRPAHDPLLAQDPRLEGIREREQTAGRPGLL